MSLIYVTNVNPRIPKATWDCLIFITYIISTNYVRKFSNRAHVYIGTGMLSEI